MTFSPPVLYRAALRSRGVIDNLGNVQGFGVPNHAREGYRTIYEIGVYVAVLTKPAARGARRWIWRFDHGLDDWQVTVMEATTDVIRKAARHALQQGFTLDQSVAHNLPLSDAHLAVIYDGHPDLEAIYRLTGMAEGVEEKSRAGRVR